MECSLEKELLTLAEIDYKNFSSSLLPDVSNILGVRLPKLRSLAKQLSKDDWRQYLTSAKDTYFEEIMLQGMIIGYANGDLNEILNYVKDFIPKIDNWSICDSFCASLKITKEYKSEVWDFIKPYFLSKDQYEVRFATVMLLNYYIDEDYIDDVLNILNRTSHEGYYAKMAIAWALSICYVKFPEKTMVLLNYNTLDDFTYNKTLQKIIESTRIDNDTKELIKSMKR